MKKEEQERQKNLKIWQKTKPSRTGIIQRSKMTTSRIGRRGKPQQERMFQGRRREKENMASFIAKKREMFLIQMSLDTKRQEIQK